MSSVQDTKAQDSVHHHSAGRIFIKFSVNPRKLQSNWHELRWSNHARLLLKIHLHSLLSHILFSWEISLIDCLGQNLRLRPKSPAFSYWIIVCLFVCLFVCFFFPLDDVKYFKHVTGRHLGCKTPLLGREDVTCEGFYRAWTLQSSIISKLLELWAANLRKKTQKAQSVPFGSNVQKWSERCRNIKKTTYKKIEAAVRWYITVHWIELDFLLETSWTFSALALQWDCHRNRYINPHDYTPALLQSIGRGPKLIETVLQPSIPEKIGSEPPRKKCANFPQKYANIRKSTQIGISYRWAFWESFKNRPTRAFTAWFDQKDFFAMFLHHSVGET